MAQIFRFLKIEVNSDGTIAADIKDAPIAVENGRVNSDITLNFGGQPLRNKGIVQLSNDRIVEMSMFIPKALLSNIPGVADFKLIKEVVEVPVSGDLRRPQMDIPQAVIKQIAPGNLLENFNPFQPKGKQPPGVIGQPSK